MFLGTVVFHIIKLVQGDANYGTLWTSELWLHMLYYGFFFVSVPAFCWLQATNLCKESLLSTGYNLYNFQFIMKIIFAMIILKKVEDRFPTGPVWVGGSFILMAIVSRVNWKGGSSMDDDGVGEEKEEEQYQMLDDVVDE